MQDKNKNTKKGLLVLALLGATLVMGGCATVQDVLDPGLDETYANKTVRAKVGVSRDAEDIPAAYDRYAASNLWKRRNIPDKETLVRDYDMYRLSTIPRFNFKLEGGVMTVFFRKGGARLEPGDIIDVFYPPLGSKEIVPSGYRLVCKHDDESCRDDPERGRKIGIVGPLVPER